MSDTSVKFSSRKFVCFSEDDAEGDFIISQEFYEIQIILLRFMTRINKQKKIRHLLTHKNIASNHLSQILCFRLTPASKTIAGKIHQIPLLVNQEVIDE